MLYLTILTLIFGVTLTNQGTRPPQPENPKGNSRDREMSQGISQKLGIPKAQQDLYKLLKVNINFKLLLCCIHHLIRKL